MPVTDPIADMLTRIRNANTANLPTVNVPQSKVKVEIARVLKEEGFISDFEDVADGTTPFRNIHITMKYAQNRQRIITGIKRISKPGLRVYAGKQELPRVLGGLGIAIVSTPKGIMTDRSARRSNLGGEILAFVW
ncbi:MAG TPA: 30S ribosomal protein S8 [Chroococcales cyanobacterium]|jgi:small subunit ribosomal protein S8